MWRPLRELPARFYWLYRRFRQLSCRQAREGDATTAIDWSQILCDYENALAAYLIGIVAENVRIMSFPHGMTPFLK